MKIEFSNNLTVRKTEARRRITEYSSPLLLMKTWRKTKRECCKNQMNVLVPLEFSTQKAMPLTKIKIKNNLN